MIKKSVMALFVSLAVLVSVYNLPAHGDTQTIGDLSIGDIVKDVRGFTEPWIVLEQDHFGDDTVLLLLKDVLPARQYHSGLTSNWPTTTLRTYLRDSFYSSLSDGFQDRIAVVTTVTADVVANDETVFVLSATEVGSSTNFYSSHGSYISSVAPYLSAPSRYWTRSPVTLSNSTNAIAVPAIGLPFVSLSNTSTTTYVRPAVNLHVDTPVYGPYSSGGETWYTLFGPDPATIFAEIQGYAANSDASALTIEQLLAAGVTDADANNLEDYRAAIAEAEAVADIAALQEIIDGVNERVFAFESIQQYATNGDATSLTIAELETAGVVGTVAARLEAYRSAIAAAEAIADTAALQAIIDGVNARVSAFEAIRQYATNGDATSLTIAELETAGAEALVATRLEAYRSAIAAAEAIADTAALQAIIDGVNARESAFESIQQYATNGDASALTIAELETAGAEELVATRLEAYRSAIAAAEAIADASALQTIIDGVNARVSAFEAIRQYATNGDATSLTIAELETAGAEELVAARLEAYGSAISAMAAIADLAALQSIIDAVNDIQVFLDLLENTIQGTNESLSTIIHDLNLVTSGGQGITVTWTSSQTEWVAENGAVTRPAHAAGNASVVLTAKIAKNEIEVSKSFDLIVLRRPAPNYNFDDETNTASPSVPEEDHDSTELLVNGQPVGERVVVRRDGQTFLTISISRQILDIAHTTEELQPQLRIEAGGEADVVIGELDGQILSELMQRQAILDFHTENASYQLPAGRIDLDAVSRLLGEDVNLEDIKIRLEISSASEDTVRMLEEIASDKGFTLVSAPMQFTIKAIYRDSSVDIADFNAYVQRSIAIPEGAGPERITTAVVVERDGALRHVPTKIVYISGKYYAQINSLTNSIYSVIWNEVEYDDTSDHWAKDAVQNMGSRLVVTGRDDGLFYPDQYVTRAEFAAVMVRGLGLKLGERSSSFEDVNKADWYHAYIQTAYEYDLISGFGDGTFGPEERITREQAMVILSRMMKITGLGNAIANREEDRFLNRFEDADTLAAWARSSVADNLKAGIVSGRSETQLAPTAYITRAEVVIMIQRLLEKSDLI